MLGRNPILILLSVLLLSLCRSAAAPANDDFASAAVLTNFPALVSGDTTDATTEPGEPVVPGAPAYASIWWQWTAPFTGRIAVVNTGSSSPWLKVFTGTDLTSLTNLISDNLDNLHVLEVTEGTVYYISLDLTSASDAPGPVQFRLTSPAVNDDFADALPLSGQMVESYSDNSLATLEPGEPDYSLGWQINSVWWTWTAPQTGPVRVSTAGSAFSAFLHVFTGSALTNLTLVAGTGGEAAFVATKGTVYHLRITGSNTYGTGRARLAIYPEVPLNDQFEDRTMLTGDSLTLMGTTQGATAQSNEPPIDSWSNGHTVWYQWTAGDFGRLTLTATNLTGAPLIPRFRLGAFTGDPLSNLTSLGGGQDTMSLLVTNGQSYIFGVDGDEGDFRLALRFTAIAIPPNDDFTNRLILSGPSVAVTNDNTRATLEKGEREPAKHMAGATLWYQWTAPVTGFARMLALGTTFEPVVSVYQGTTLHHLKSLANSLGSDSGNLVVCSLSVVAGQTYVIAVDGRQTTGRGQFIFGIDLTTLRLTGLASAISAGAPPALDVNIPSGLADGQLEAVTYLGVLEDGEVRELGVGTGPSFSFTPTNLSPGLITFYGVGTNTEGAQRITPPVLLKVRPVNDDFAQSLPLSGYQWSASGYTAQASKEKGEPGAGPASVWWQWTAPASGQVAIETQLGDPGTALRKRTLNVYTGADLRHLQPVRWTSVVNDPRADAWEAVRFNATGGTTYYLQVVARTADLDPGTWPFLLRGSLSGFAFSAPLGQSFTESTNVLLAVTTSEDPGSVQQVDFLASDGYTNNELIGSVFSAPYQMIWSNALPGNYRLEARLLKNTGPNPPSAFTTVSIRPVNDDFANRIVLETNFSWLSHRIAGATREPGEPAHNGNATAASAWWTWTAPADGKIYISDPTQQTSTGLALYSGTNLTTLQAVPLSKDTVYGTSEVADVKGGTAYQFAAIPGSTPEVNLQLRFYPPPPNDNFSNRTVLSGDSVALAGYTVGATREPGEPAYGLSVAGNSVWWSWTAPSSGAMTLTQRAGLWELSGVYTGTSLQTLQPVLNIGSYPSPSSLEVVGGTTYQIAVVSYWGDEENIEMDLNFQADPTNDAFASPALLQGTNVTLTADNWGASSEPGEPAAAPGASGRSLWSSWTAPSDGNAYVSAAVSAQYPHGTFMLQAFTGDSLDALQLLPGGGGDELSFRAVSNQTYRIRFDSSVPASTTVSLNLVAAPTNDDFVNAAALTGTNLAMPGSTRGASPQPGDPLVWQGLSQTIWYSWTAPESASMIAAVTQASDFYGIRAFTGGALADLAPTGVQNQHDSVVFQAQAGTTYYFAVAGKSWWEPAYPDQGFFELLLMPGGQPANDNFANATLLTGNQASILATNWGATLEPGDPPLVQWRNLRRTLWYEWVAPGDGLLQLADAGSTVPPVVGSYAGTNLAQLTIIGDWQTQVHANDLVHILIDGDYGDGGILSLSLTFTPAPAFTSVPTFTPAPALALAISSQVRKDQFRLQVSGPPQSGFRVEYSSDLSHWQPLQTGVLTNRVEEVTDTNTAGARARFYRVIPWP